MNPLVTVIVPNYNKEKYIIDALQSVIHQTYIHWELIIVDDCSTDNSLLEIKTCIASSTKATLICNTSNKGANYCRNIGLQHAKGEYIVFLDADDILKKTCLQNRIKIVVHNNCHFTVFAMETFMDTIGDSNNFWIPNSTQPLVDFLQHKLPWQTMQPIWQRNYLLLIHGFDEDFERMQDVELHTKALLLSNVKYAIEPTIIDCYYRVNDLRKNFDIYNFMHRWITSAVKYHTKYYTLVAKQHKRYLSGTLYQVYFELLKSHRYKGLSAHNKQTLSALLFSAPYFKPTLVQQKIIKLTKFYNLYLFRIPGLNTVLKKIFTL
jgi:glycosyltransferase involved in cell wall biosynthesis